ncbi:PAQR family membrane homeostasis protein TrhA, partial [Streptomyces sp. NPDC002740]
PAWFGFHEVFHALTIAAFTAQYTAILLAVA